MAYWRDWFEEKTENGQKVYKIPPDKHALIVGWARSGLTDKQIAFNIGIADQTFRNWKSKYPEFRRALKNGKQVADFLIENALFNKAASGDVTAMIFWLKNRMPNEWQNLPDSEKELKKYAIELAKARAEIAKNTSDKLTLAENNQLQINDLIEIGRTIIGDGS